VVAEEQFYAEHERYGTLGAPEAESEIDLTLGPGVRWVAQAEFGTRGHYLLLSHDEALELACAVYVGDVGSRARSTLAGVPGEDAAEGAPGCKVFETVRVCPDGHASPSLLNWNYCPYDGGRLRDSVPDASPVEWDRRHPESDRADIATLAVAGGTVDITAFHNKLMPDSLASEAKQLQLRGMRGDSVITMALDAYRVPSLLEDLGRGGQAVLAIADEGRPTSLTVRLVGQGNTLAFTCAGATGCRPAGPYVLVFSLTQQDVRDLLRALTTAVSAFEAYEP
jgi:hypothetical protein